MSKTLSRAARREFIDDRLNREWGWADYKKPAAHDNPKAYSYRDMAVAITRAYPGHDFNPMTIRRDVIALRDSAIEATDEELSEGAELLKPENFGEWRSKFFTAPDGQPYETPKHQMAAFWVMHALVHKTPLPAWVIEYLDEQDPLHPFPENINDLLTDGKHLISFLFLMAPRHGKTDLAIHFAIHTFCGDPNKRILWGNGTIEKSSTFMDNAINWVLENNEELNRLYGPFKDDNRPWSKKGFVLAQRTIDNKSNSMQPYGISGNIRSYDSDLIIGDDLTDLRRSQSETTTEQDYEQITTELMTRREPQTGLILLGSHVPVMHGDVLTQIEENSDRLNMGNHVLIIKKLPAHNYQRCDLNPKRPDGTHDHLECLLWPSKRPFEFLEALRGMMNDDTMYEAVYNQIPRTKGMLHFPSAILRNDFIQIEPNKETGIRPVPIRSEVEVGALDSQRSWRRVPTCCKGMQVMVALGFDPAASTKKGSSFTAIVVLGACPFCNRRYIIDSWKERQSPEEHPGSIEMFLRDYPAIDVVNIEINAYQKALARHERVVAFETKYKVRINEWNTDSRKDDPVMGIPMSASWLKSGLLSIPAGTITDRELAEPFIKELQRWPRKPNDIVMAYWLADVVLKEMIDEYQITSAELMPGYEKHTSEAHAEFTYEVDLSQIDWEEWG